ncbi:MAG: GNAT family N-acetyltransferase [Alphaproteobacteria bacterium]
MIVRPAIKSDMLSCEMIYAHHVKNGSSSFDEEPPRDGALDDKRVTLQAKGYPFLVLEHKGNIWGYAYAAPYRTRSGYRFSAENSIYVRFDKVGLGLSSKLMEPLIDACREKGLRSLIAVIGMDQDQEITENHSYRAHAKAGFKLTGVLDNIGFKFGRWMKTALMCLDLNR